MPSMMPSRSEVRTDALMKKGMKRMFWVGIGALFVRTDVNRRSNLTRIGVQFWL
jgi:hypothetical protein